MSNQKEDPIEILVSEPSVPAEADSSEPKVPVPEVSTITKATSVQIAAVCHVPTRDINGASDGFDGYNF